MLRRAVALTPETWSSGSAEHRDPTSQKINLHAHLLKDFVGRLRKKSRRRDVVGDKDTGQGLVA